MSPTDAPWADMKCPCRTKDNGIYLLIESLKAWDFNPLRPSAVVAWNRVIMV
jgi:hypothetical protein